MISLRRSLAVPSLPGLQAAWSSILVLTGTYRALFTRVVYTERIFFALLVVGLIAARRRAHGGTGEARTPNPACHAEARRAKAGVPSPYS